MMSWLWYHSSYIWHHTWYYIYDRTYDIIGQCSIRSAAAMCRQRRPGLAATLPRLCRPGPALVEPLGPDPLRLSDRHNQCRICRSSLKRYGIVGWLLPPMKHGMRGAQSVHETQKKGWETISGSNYPSNASHLWYIWLGCHICDYILIYKWYHTSYHIRYMWYHIWSKIFFMYDIMNCMISYVIS